MSATPNWPALHEGEGETAGRFTNAWRREWFLIPLPGFVTPQNETPRSLWRWPYVMTVQPTQSETSASKQSAASSIPDNDNLRAQSAAYERALKGSNVAVFTQDLGLRYNSISGPMLGRSASDMLGHDDEAILPAKSRNTIVALKRDVIASGSPRSAEVCVGEGADLRWYDLHVEPLRKDGARDGDVVGLGGVSVDITERKEGEAHLRLLMRELTHRSKNLLAVIQAMARQSAHHAGSIDKFLDHFNARLHALAASHDLLVRESWHGAALRELVHSQLSPYLVAADTNVEIDGPPVVLTPEAAQGVGLALHELAANAVKHGALSVAGGSVSATWNTEKPDGGVTLTWEESSGPAVKPRRKRGFGTLVIEHNLVRALNAEVNWTFEPRGVCCEIAIPRHQVLDPR